jgi:hypothetical protein
MQTVKFTYAYSGSIAKFAEMKKGDTLDVTDTEYNILLNLGVIEGSKSLHQIEKDAEIANKKEEKTVLKTKEEKHSNTTK